MKPEAILFLENDVLAQRMVAAWPSAGKGSRKYNFDILEVWASKAGVKIERAIDIAETLFANEICGTGGKVHEMAIKYIQREVARKAGILGKKKEDGQPKKAGG